MNWFMLIPLAIKFMSLAEALLSGPKTGAQKKAMVTEGLKTVVETVSAASTGGQKETWEKIAPHVDPLIDSIAGVMFPHPDEAGRIETSQPSG